MLGNDKPRSIEINIAAPCSASWDAMEGDDKTRSCAQCHLNVYNISSMSAREAEEFLSARIENERVCVRFFRRHDGMIITDDCPVGLKRLRDLVRMIQIAAVSVISLLLWGAPTQARSAANDLSSNGPQPTRFPMHRGLSDFVKPVVSGRPILTTEREAVMGGIPANNFAPSMKAMQKKIQEKWKLYHFDEKKGPTVAFKVYADGRVSGISIEHSSGSNDKDLAAIQAVLSASPYDKLPFHQSEVEIQFTFSRVDSE